MDDDLERAIALSLNDTREASKSREVIEISDDEDEDLQTALKLSKPDQPQTIAPVLPVEPERGASTSTFLSERAQLERERLARQKRLHGDVNVRSGGKRQAEGSEDDSEDDEGREPPAKVQRQDFPPSSRRRVLVDAALTSAEKGDPSSSSSSSAEELFWDGELRQTANAHVDPAKDTRPTFRLSQILGQKSEISCAIMSSYCIDWPWIYQFFDPKTPVVMVAQPDESGNAELREVLPNWIRTRPFLRNGRGCMHMKFMLIFYKSGRLRVVINTANFIDYDWRDIENSTWLQDIPLRSSPIPHDSKARDFPAAFQRVLHALDVESALATHVGNDHVLLLGTVNDLRCKWDFSRVKAQLVPSIAGKHEGWPKVLLTGHPALMKAVRDLNVRPGPSRSLNLECQGSSIGLYSTQWLNEFYHSARGESAEDWLDHPKTRRAKLPLPSGIKVIFPSLATVRASKLGEPGGGTIFCRKNQWESSKFPRELFHDSESKRGKVLMHSKMILATLGKKGSQPTVVHSDSETEDSDIEVVDPRKATNSGADDAGWIYVGSHNFTPSAWGTLSGSAFGPVLNIVNYEIGVVLPIKDPREADSVACWKRPPKKYAAGKDRPWMQEESSVHQAA